MPPSLYAGTKLCCSSGLCKWEDKTVSCWLGAWIPATGLALLLPRAEGEEDNTNLQHGIRQSLWWEPCSEVVGLSCLWCGGESCGQ